MLSGIVRHRDSIGNSGEIGGGDVHSKVKESLEPVGTKKASRQHIQL
jgi:hypothetical protein